jgi:hypothetical protein
MTVDTTSSVTDLFGDPAGLAEYQFRLALDRCAECRDYHSVWPYRRLSRMVFGIETGADIVEALLREFTQQNGRILIAGSADAGLTALTARATKDQNPFIDVADRCPTPLGVCRRFAQAQSLPVRTLQLDFGSTLPQRRYDVVFGHCIVQFVPPPSRVDFLRKLGQAMTRRGALILVERLHIRKEDDLRHRDYAAETLDALAAQGIKLPEDESSFRVRLDRIVNVRRTRIEHSLSSSELNSCLAGAGFHIRELSDCDRQRTVILPNGESVTLEFAVAFPIVT